MNFRLTWCTCILSLLTLYAQAQTLYQLDLAKSEVIIKGTSSLHDWWCRAEQLTGTLQAVLEQNQLSELKSLSATASVAAIRSIREDGSYYEKGMDKNVYRAMKSEQHPSVTFSLSKITSLTRLQNGLATVNATGNLRIAGVTKSVSISATAKIQQGGIVFEGKVPIKMTDYSIDPPTALFGTIKTGNEVDVHFKMVFQSSK